MRDLRGQEIAMIFQDPMTSLNPVLTIEEQMVETIQAHKQVTIADARARAVELLGMVGIPEPPAAPRDFPHQFCGGMRQRVMIAMALALEPKLLIADEPTTALDVTIQAQVLELLQRLTSEEGTAVILITHDLGVVAGMTGRINVMYAGFVVEAATTPDLFARPRHPYTVGLLHSLPRVDATADEPLIPIEGVPAGPARRAGRLPVRPALRVADRPVLAGDSGAPPSRAGAPVRTTGPGATHRIACWNPPTPEEAAAGAPLRPDFTPAAPPDEPARAPRMAAER